MTEWSDEAVDEAVRDWAEGRAAPASGDGAAFVDAVWARRAQRGRGRWVAAVAAAALLVAVLGVVLAISGGDPSGGDVPAAPEGHDAPELADVPPPAPPDEVLWPQIRFGEATLGSGARSTLAARERVVADLGDDRIAVEAGTVGYTAIRRSGGRGVRTVLQLSEGRLAAQVAPRTDGGLFQVVAGDLSVRVLGTRFGVERADTETIVTVEEGTVSVRILTPSGPEDVTLEAGQRLRWPADEGRGAGTVEDHASIELLALLTPAPIPALAPPRAPDAPPRAPAPPEPPPLASVLAGHRAQMVAGDVAGARAALEALVADHPDDPDVLALLSFAQRRDGAPVAAAETLLRAAAAAPSQEGRFVYDAASLLDAAGQPARVVELLAPRVDAQVIPGALLPDARLRLGRAQLATGATDAGRATLDELVRAHPGTGAASTAIGLLGEIENSL